MIDEIISWLFNCLAGYQVINVLYQQIGIKGIRMVVVGFQSVRKDQMGLIFVVLPLALPPATPMITGLFMMFTP